MGEKSIYRYELKYALQESDLVNLYAIISQHPSSFKTAFPDRTVNNIYFDNVNFQCCFENLDGISERTKIRYRWYGEEEQFSKGKLELKIKKNALGTKKYFELDHPNDVNDLEFQVKNTLNKHDLQAALHNQYLRSYFIDDSRKYRLTIDRNLSYWLPNQYSEIPSYSDNRIIVELKFDQEDASTIDKVTRFFPFRLSKHSKYGSGLMNLVY